MDGLFSDAGLRTFLITLLVNGAALFVLSKLPLGIWADNIGATLVWAFVFALLNSLLLPVLEFLTIPITFITFGFFRFVLNAVIFALASSLTKGIELRGGCLSAFLGSIGLGLLNSFILGIIGGAQ